MITGNDWDQILQEEIESERFQQLQQFLAQEYATRTIYPSMNNIYNALRLTPYHSVKIVILGQDPYHGPGQAHGLAFSVQKGVPVPPSLQNIYKELNADIGFRIPGHGCLTGWAEQGVLLLNTVLTVRAGQANSHKGMGWEPFTDAVIQKLNERETPMVFLLWGRNAAQKKPLITNSAHLVLTAAHPSPLSAYNGFFGCRHFSQATNFLNQQGMNIDWQIPD
jgi:uracil-DNA glycosylase